MRHKWFWISCTRCHHSAVAAMAPFDIRWGMLENLHHRVRRYCRCSECGAKEAWPFMPSWDHAADGFLAMPPERLLRVDGGNAEFFPMCSLYSLTKGQRAILDAARAMVDHTGNMPPLPGIFPDYRAPIVRNNAGTRELAYARWGLPSPKFAIEGKNSDPGVVNVRNAASPHWRRWLGVENRCAVPFTSFSEPQPGPPGQRPPVWFAFDESRPLTFFAGLWVPQWTSVRKVKEGKTTNDLFGFLTCPPNTDVAPIHPKAMPVILATAGEIETWLTAPMAEAMQLQRPLPDGSLKIVARGEKEDG